MEREFEHNGVKLSISIKEIEDVHPHEEVNADIVSQLSRQIELDGDQKDPIVIDRTSNVALDGMHRIAAMKQLDARRIVTCELDYDDPSVILRRWLRYLPALTDDVLRELDVKVRFERTSRADALQAVDNLASPLALLLADRAYLSRRAFTDIVQAYELIRIFDERVKAHHLQYYSLPEDHALDRSLSAGATLYMPALKKKDILDIVSKGRLLPVKTTRHVIPIRPMGVCFPLEHLGFTNRDRALELLDRILRDSKPRVVPARSHYEERFYEEALLIISGQQ